jgi:hypothetical protein
MIFLRRSTLALIDDEPKKMDIYLYQFVKLIFLPIG